MILKEIKTGVLLFQECIYNLGINGKLAVAGKVFPRVYPVIFVCFSLIGFWRPLVLKAKTCTRSKFGLEREIHAVSRSAQLKFGIDLFPKTYKVNIKPEVKFTRYLKQEFKQHVLLSFIFIICSS